MIYVEKIRRDFPMYRNCGMFEGKPLHYLDNAATSFKPYSVLNAMNHYYVPNVFFKNCSSDMDINIGSSNFHEFLLKYYCYGRFGDLSTFVDE